MFKSNFKKKKEWNNKRGKMCLFFMGNAIPAIKITKIFKK